MFKKFLVLLTLPFLLLTGCKADSMENSHTQKNGLVIEDLVVGDGSEVKKGNTVEVHYTGSLEDGTVFDSSLERAPFSFKVGNGDVIAGWDQGLVGMKVGGKRKLTIPSSLGYGDRGYPGVIPGGATLIFEIELLSIE